MQTINVRKLQRNMKEIATKVQQGESFVVLKNSTFIFQINPVPKQLYKKNEDRQKEFITLHKIFQNLQFKTGQKDASKKIDEIVYAK